MRPTRWRRARAAAGESPARDRCDGPRAMPRPMPAEEGSYLAAVGTVKADVDPAAPARRAAAAAIASA